MINMALTKYEALLLLTLEELQALRNTLPPDEVACQLPIGETRKLWAQVTNAISTKMADAKHEQVLRRMGKKGSRTDGMTNVVRHPNRRWCPTKKSLR